MITFYALAATLILIALVVFQLTLIFGAPIGKYAWGGKHTLRPRNLRIGGVTSIVLYAVFALFVLSKAGIIGVITDPTVLNVGMWVFTAYFFLGIPLNAISRSNEHSLVTHVVKAGYILIRSS